MVPKILHWLALTACVVLVISCFLPWAYYADVHETFNGFFSHNYQYGRPGKFLVTIAVTAFVFILLPKVWAKRTNIFVCALGVGYAIKCYVLFTTCYNAVCPDKKAGIYIMLFATIVMLAGAIFPDMKLKKQDAPEQ